jgi:hypothetical protein
VPRSSRLTAPLHRKIRQSKGAYAPALGATPPELDLAKLASAQFNSPLGGWVAQSVEQRTENPCVAGSIPAPATILRPQMLTSNLPKVTKGRFDTGGVREANRKQIEILLPGGSSSASNVPLFLSVAVPQFCRSRALTPERQRGIVTP